MSKLDTCSMCGRLLDVPNDPLSGDCGGDCWGCVGRMEAKMGDPDGNPSADTVGREIAAGLRNRRISEGATWSGALRV